MSSSQILSEGSERTLESPEDLLITRLAKLDLNQSTSEQDIPSVPLPGLEKVYESLVELLLYPLRYPNHFARLNIEAPKGVLLYGPPGVGKTFLVAQAARICKAQLISVDGPSIYGPYVGESEARLRAVFDQARTLCETSNAPVIIFIDELDALTPNRNTLTNAGGQESRIVAQLLTLMDGMRSAARWVVVAATNRPNAIDPALRRPGRFDRELRVDPPGEQTRARILRYLTLHLPVAADVSFDELAVQTNGYVGADLASLCREAASFAILRATKSSQSATAPPCLTRADFEEAMQRVTPSMLRSTRVEVAPTRWEDIGGLDEAKKKLRQAVEWPLKYAASFKRLGLVAPRGVLLYGPPGCSKTTLVKAIATTSGASFFALPGASVYSAYVGESERIVRDIFYRARLSAPAVIFLDEIDALVGKRDLGDGGSSSDPVRDRVLTTLLTEMDGIETANSVLVVGATNRPDMLDAALLRPGRFDRQIYIPPPDTEARVQILKIHTRKIPLADDVDLEAIAAKTSRYSGADLQNICREAAMSALRRTREADRVTAQDFDDALGIVPPSLSKDILQWYDDYHKKIIIH